jgi:hypothetical protein
MIQLSVAQISQFMAQFSSLVTDTPTFLRLGIELKHLRMFGINFEELTMLEMPMITSKSQQPGGSSDADTSSAAGFGLAGGSTGAGDLMGGSVFGGFDSKDGGKDSADTKYFPTPQQVFFKLQSVLSIQWPTNLWLR